MSHISKYFKLPTFLAAQSHGRIAWVLEIERHLFPSKRIIILSPIVHIKLDTVEHTKSHRFSLLPSSLLLFSHCSLHRSTFPCNMFGEADQTSNIASDTTMSDSKGAAGVESETASASSSSNVAVLTMAKKEVPKMYE
jgi:hypothetical protein